MGSNASNFVKDNAHSLPNETAVTALSACPKSRALLAIGADNTLHFLLP